MESTSTSAAAQQLSLSPVVSPRGFIFPSIYSFPPFFTQQPNTTTWSHQLSQWSALILAYCRFHRVFRLALSEETCDLELFRNKAIDRRLDLKTLRTIIDGMILTRSAAYDPSPSKGVLPTGALIYWRTPEEWATLIYTWINEQGLTNSIMTFYELTTGGDLAETTEFYNLPEALLRQALDVLIRSNKAQVFKGVAEGEEGDGVKFI